MKTHNFAPLFAFVSLCLLVPTLPAKAGEPAPINVAQAEKSIAQQDSTAQTAYMQTCLPSIYTTFHTAVADGLASKMDDDFDLYL